MSNQKEIDWSKAPEGAQGFMPRTTLWAEGWWKQCRGKRFFCHAGKDEWNQTYADPFGQHGFVYRPDPDNAVAWSGEGLPPAGTLCEAQPWKEHDAPWKQMTVIAHWCAPNGITYSWCRSDYGTYEPQALRFRPIRTPEQIAAEEREKAIQQLAEGLHVARGFRSPFEHTLIVAEWLHDNGYRKVTP